MKGYNFDTSFKDKIINQYNNEYGLNYSNYNEDDINKNYDRFFITKNNLNVHNKINKQK